MALKNSSRKDTPSRKKKQEEEKLRHEPALIGGKYSYKDLIDLDRLKDTFEKFSTATGFSIALIDQSSLKILIASNWRDICSKFNSTAKGSVESCDKCIIQFLDDLNEPGKAISGKCENGLNYCATPIFIRGVHAANIINCQLLFEKPDISGSKKHSQKSGFNEKDFLRAIKEVPIVSEEKARALTVYLGGVAEFILDAGLIQAETMEKAEMLEKEIAGRILLEAPLRYSEEKFRVAFNNSPYVMGISTIEDGRYIDVNDKFEKFIGWKREDVIGHTSTEIGIFKDCSARDAVVNLLKKQGYLSNYEMDFVTKSGETRSGEFSAQFFDINDKPCLLVSVNDITEKRQAEKAHKESEYRYSQLVNLSPDAIIVHKEGILMYANPAALKMFGAKDFTQYIGKNLIEFTHPDYRGIVLERRKLLEQGMSIPPLEMQCLDINGKAFDVEATVGKINFFGEDATLNILRDITERKNAEKEKILLEKQLQQSQKLESIGVLAGGLAHDFNNMLAAIIGNADLALMNLSDVSPAVPRIRNIKNISLSAANLCKQMLAYSGKGRFIETSLHLTEVINEMRPMLEASIPKNVRLSYSLNDNVPFIRADLSQMQQVIMNIVINAGESIGERPGMVNITSSAVECDEAYLKTVNLLSDIPEGTYVCFEVTDTGCGMDKATMEKIFDPFFTTKFTGRGLGLAAVMGIVRSHKGTVKLYSEPGSGTTFKVMFPAVRDALYNELLKHDAVDRWTGSGTLLLVDDEEDIRDVGKELLKSLGFEVLTAPDGFEAMKIFKKNRDRIRCVLLDLTMPRMGGEETFNRLRQLDPEIKVILSSGYNEHDVLGRFNGKGLSGFIQKPYIVANLIEALKKALKSG